MSLFFIIDLVVGVMESTGYGRDLIFVVRTSSGILDRVLYIYLRNA
jgi:hypothetical protein